MLSKVPDDLPRERERSATLLILPPETSAAYDTTRMAYSVRRYEIAYFRDNEWAETPGQMIGDLLVRTLSELGTFKAVLTSPAAQPATYRLQTTILELLQDHTAGTPVLRLGLRVRLFDRTGQLIADRDIQRDQVLTAPTPYAGVVAANDATALALRDAAQFVQEAVRGRGIHSRTIF